MKKETKKETKKVISKKTKTKATPVVKKIEAVESIETCCCENKPKKGVLFYVSLFLVVAIAGVVYYKFANVATVNGKPISRIEYINLFQKQDNRNVLNRMVQEELINQEAVKNNVKIEKSQIDAEISRIEENLKTQGQTLDEALKANSMTKTDLEDQMRMKMNVEKLSNANAEVNQAQIDEFVTKNKASLPKDMSKEQLQTMIKEQLASQAKDEAINGWLEKVTNEAKVIYK